MARCPPQTNHFKAILSSCSPGVLSGWREIPCPNSPQNPSVQLKLDDSCISQGTLCTTLERTGHIDCCVCASIRRQTRKPQTISCVCVCVCVCVRAHQNLTGKHSRPKDNGWSESHNNCINLPPFCRICLLIVFKRSGAIPRV